MADFRFNEKYLSQIPALQLLITLGYTYLPPAETTQLRSNKYSNVLLEPILRQRLQAMNRITFRGNEYDYTESNIDEAIRRLKVEAQGNGLRTANEAIYDLLLLGTSLPQTLDGTNRSYSLRYIDWDNWQNNVFHVTAEYVVERTASVETARPDIVLFVNGIPFGVIECKSPKIDVQEGVSQSIRNQGNEYIPKLFVYGQLVMATNKNAVKYATIGTGSKFWSVWKEPFITEAEVQAWANTSLPPAQKDALFSDPEFAKARYYFDQLEAAGDREITAQDWSLCSLYQPARLLDITRRFTVFDGGTRKVARHQQYKAVNKLMARVQQPKDDGRRQGGVIWHTQGSGKSLTMVMIAKALVLDPAILNPRVVLVTDRISLDGQLKGTFQSCGLEPVQAKTGKHLTELVKDKTTGIITTIINKFEAAVKDAQVVDESNNIFILVDESHRSQYGTLHPKMKKVFPKGCYIGFTGTPLKKKDKDTAQKFGGMIDQYTIREAVEDGAVVPLLYEGRHSEAEVNQKAIDTWFERHCKGLTEDQIAKLKKKYSRVSELNKAEQVIFCRAFDISDHYRASPQTRDLKAQLVAPDKKSALRYHQCLKDIGHVTSEVIISGPDTREGHEEVNEEPTDEVIRFWKQMMDRYGSEKQYNEQITENFKNSDHPQILIVVDKLLTGFDAPRNVVLYITRPLREHTLLQAIARVNRVFSDNKNFGYIVDYAGVLEELDQAMATYSENWQGFDPKDLEQAITNIKAEIAKLPQVHANLLKIFEPITNTHDETAYENLLVDDEALRDDFYERLSQFSKVFAIALSSEQFITDTPETKIKSYRDDLKRFQNLKAAVKLRCADDLDVRDLEPKIKKLLDTHLSASEVTPLTGPVNIFDENAFNNAVNSQRTPRAKADLIANNTRRVINQKYDEDPTKYQKLSEMLQKAIDDFRERRISELEYLQQTQNVKASVVTPTDDDTPEEVKNDPDAQAFFGLLNTILTDHTSDPQQLHQVSLNATQAILGIIRSNVVRDWHQDSDHPAQKAMANAIDDYLYDVVQEEYKLNLDTPAMDRIIKESIRLAKNRPSFHQ